MVCQIGWKERLGIVVLSGPELLLSRLRLLNIFGVINYELADQYRAWAEELVDLTAVNDLINFKPTNHYDPPMRPLIDYLRVNPYYFRRFLISLMK